MGNEIKISKVLESILARIIFDVSRSGESLLLKDRLMAGILREEASMAVQMLASKYGRRLVESLCEAVEQERTKILDVERRSAADAAGAESEAVAPHDFYRDFVALLHESFSAARHLSTAHAMTEIVSDTSTLSSSLFAAAGITAESLAKDMSLFAGGGGEASEPEAGGVALMPAEAAVPEFLLRFGTDLTQAAREGRLDAVVGRRREIERVVQILSRRKKNNPVLVGEAGVGKSAIVEGVAALIASGRAPYAISGKRIFALDVAALVAGTKFRGEFEERMQQLMQHLRRSPDIILFIDEIHTIVGAGSTQGALDVANILKPALARGELQTIGATTLDEFRNCIESDAALERRFQRVVVEPSSPADTLEILQSVAPHYERHHGVRYTAEALQACIDLSVRYIADRHLPDKAVDLLDESGSQAALARDRRPQRLRRLDSKLEEERERCRRALDVAEYEQAALARLHESALRARIKEVEGEWRNRLAANPATVDVDDIAGVVTAVCGVPVERLREGEAARLRDMERHLHSRVIGQTEAVSRVAAAVRRSRAGLKDASRPAGVLMFVGSTGVGKTLLAKELSAWLFGERQGLVRIDMSEYGEAHSVARLIGSPPGYVGYGESGQLSEAVRRRPWSVVLFDEIEKAHPDVFNTMLQIFDEGRLTDGSGREVDFRNTIIIMTSNAGSREVAERAPQIGFATSSKRENERHRTLDGYRRALEGTFAPEFLNRVDEVILFRPLSQRSVERIVDLETARLIRRVESLGYSLRLTAGARRMLATLGFESRYGARPLRRVIAERVEEPLAELIVGGALRKGDGIVVERSRDGVAVKVK